MKFEKLLIANRGEVAIRIMRSAAELGIRTIAIYPQDDSESLHVRYADSALELPGSGPAAYLDMKTVLDFAEATGCQAIHPGYGFLSERADFAQLCQDHGIVFVGPGPGVLTLFGDKSAARELAVSEDVPVLAGTGAGLTSGEAESFLASLPSGSSMMLKAVAGGGGRGQRVVHAATELPNAFSRCESEAATLFGDGRLFAEQYLPQARHIEVQVIGDESGAITHLYDRDCSIQRRFQKIIEIAPAPRLNEAVRATVSHAAVRMARKVAYSSLGTFEFLVSEDDVYFLEANPRLQVEHTVTETVLGLDLVRAQIQIAAGKTLAELNLAQSDVVEPRGFAVEARINMETMSPDGSPVPAAGLLTTFEVPSGPGLRTDSFGYAGYRTSTQYDSLLAKVIAYSPSPQVEDALAKAARALDEVRISGVATNTDFLAAVLRHPAVVRGAATTRFVDEHAAELIAAIHRNRPDAGTVAVPVDTFAGFQVDASDPLAVLNVRAMPQARTPAETSVPTDDEAQIASPVQGTLIEVNVKVGDAIPAGHQVAVMEAMKMEHPITSAISGIVLDVRGKPGDTVLEGHTLVVLEQAEVSGSAETEIVEVDLGRIRPDLREVLDRQMATLDNARPDSVAKRHRRGRRTARENIADLCDDGTFVEHGALVLTTGTGLPTEDVIRNFPGDAMVCGIGNVNGDQFGLHNSRTAILSYDYMVLAGTQSQLNHLKTDRILELASDWELPVIFFTEGGGGRAGTGGQRAGGGQAAPSNNANPRSLAVASFAAMGRLSGHVPTIGVNCGFCFAGNAALLGMCDVIIATEDSTIGMGGPALIEGGGLGVFAPEDVGPIDVQVANGVVDIVVHDEAEGVDVAKRYLSYFQGPVDEWSAADQRRLRHIVPENRLRTYNMRELIATLADEGTMLELRQGYGRGMITALARIEGQPVGIVANNPEYLAGAIDSEGAIKAGRFMSQLDSFDIPLVVLCDTPGIMVGPESEKTGSVRHCNTMFTIGAQLEIPLFMVIVRKAVGLGAIAMAGGSIMEPAVTVAWPTGEFAGMGIEGQIKLGYRKELEAIEDPARRMERYRELVDEAYQRSKAVQQAAAFHIDDVIDPIETRRILANGLRSIATPDSRRRAGPRRRGRS